MSVCRKERKRKEEKGGGREKKRKEEKEQKRMQPLAGLDPLSFPWPLCSATSAGTSFSQLLLLSAHKLTHTGEGRKKKREPDGWE